MSEELKLSASNFGFDVSWIADVLTKYGDTVLALCIEAARNGFSIAFVVEILNKFGPAFLEFLVSLLTQNQAMRMRLAATSEVLTGDVVTTGGDLIQGLDAGVIQVLIEKYMPMIIEKYLPVLIEKYGDQLMQFFVQMILNALKPKQ